MARNISAEFGLLDDENAVIPVKSVKRNKSISDTFGFSTIQPQDLSITLPETEQRVPFHITLTPAFPGETEEQMIERGLKSVPIQPKDAGQVSPLSPAQIEGLRLNEQVNLMAIKQFGPPEVPAPVAPVAPPSPVKQTIMDSLMDTVSKIGVGITADKKLEAEGARVASNLGLSMATMPIAGAVAAPSFATYALQSGQDYLNKKLNPNFKPSGDADKALATANRTYEKLASLPIIPASDKANAKAEEQIGEAIALPFKTAGAGWGGIAELITTGSLEEAAKVIEGTSQGSSIFVPLAKVGGEAGAVFGLGGISKTFKSRVLNADWFRMMINKNRELALYIPTEADITKIGNDILRAREDDIRTGKYRPTDFTAEVESAVKERFGYEKPNSTKENIKTESTEPTEETSNTAAKSSTENINQKQIDVTTLKEEGGLSAKEISDIKKKAAELRAASTKSTKVMNDPERSNIDPTVDSVVPEITSEPAENGNRITDKSFATTEEIAKEVEPPDLSIFNRKVIKATTDINRFIDTAKGIGKVDFKTDQKKIAERKNSEFKVYPHDEVRTDSKTNKESFIKWLTMNGDTPAAPTVHYRGSHFQDELPGSKHTHVTPWLGTAHKGGKLGSEGTPVRAYPVKENHLYYRGGSLAGDPFERTRIGSVEGQTWSEALNKAKQLYDKELAKRIKENKKYFKQSGYEFTTENLNNLKRHVAEDVYGDFRNATFETDAYNRPGKWRGRTDIPKGFNKEQAPVRLNDKVAAWDKKYEESKKDTKLISFNKNDNTFTNLSEGEIEDIYFDESQPKEIHDKAAKILADIAANNSGILSGSRPVTVKMKKASTGKVRKSALTEEELVADGVKPSTIQKIKSIITNESGALNTGEQIGFMSKLKEVATFKTSGKMEVSQLKKMLENNGVTKAEIEAVLGDLKDGDIVTKAQVMDEIKTMGTKIKKDIKVPYTPITSKTPKASYLYSGLDPIAALKALGQTVEDVADGVKYLNQIGEDIYKSGKEAYSDWINEFKNRLGELWERFKDFLDSVWASIKHVINNEHGALRYERTDLNVGKLDKDGNKIAHQRLIKRSKKTKLTNAFEELIKLRETTVLELEAVKGIDGKAKFEKDKATRLAKLVEELANLKTEAKQNERIGYQKAIEEFKALERNKYISKLESSIEKQSRALGDLALKIAKLKYSQIPDVIAPAVLEKDLNFMMSLNDRSRLIMGGYWTPPIFTIERTGHENQAVEFKKAFKDKTPIPYDKTKAFKLLEIFYHPIVDARKMADDNTKKQLDKSKEIRKDLPNGSAKRIGTYAIAQQVDLKHPEKSGQTILDAMGIPKEKVPVLTPEEMKVYKYHQKAYSILYDRINEARLASGLKPFDPVAFYHKFASDLSFAEKLKMGLDDPYITEHMKASATTFDSAKARKGGLKSVNLDFFEVFDRYVQVANTHIYVSPKIAKMRELIEVRHSWKEPAVDKNGKAITKKRHYSMRRNQPRMYSDFSSYLNAIAGRKKVVMPEVIEKGLALLRHNNVYAYMSASARSVLIQPAAVLNAYIVTGLKYTTKGAIGLMTKARKEAIRESKVLEFRNMDLDVAEATSGAIGKLGEARVWFNKKIGMRPLRWLDGLTADAARMAYKEYATEVLGLDEYAANRYADNNTVKTQSSGALQDRAPIQRVEWGRAVTTLQSFVIANWAWLTQDVMGIGNASMKKSGVFKAVMKFLIGSMILSLIYEEGIGIDSPVPNPAGEFVKSYNEHQSVPMATFNASLEALQFVPGMGGFRYGSSMLGAPADLLVQTTKKIASYTQDQGSNYVEDVLLMQDKKGFTKPVMELAGTWLGIPGTKQVARFAGVTNQDENAPTSNAILGIYNDKKKSGGGLKSSLKSSTKSGLKSSLK